MVVCRSCKSTDLEKIVSLGNSPLANNFLTKEELASKEVSYPLEVYFCKDCGLSQLGYIVPAEKMFSNYLYMPSTSDTFVKHFSDMASDLTQRFDISKGDLILDIGGNDGTLLKEFKKYGANVLNIEPAKNIAEVSEAKGVETFNDYFTEVNALKILEKVGKAKMIIGTNVFTHIDNLDDFIKGVETLLDNAGVLVIEVYYLGSIIKNMSFDIIYHEHLSYFTANSLKKLFEKHNMTMFDVKLVPIHGGSLRVFVCNSGAYPIEPAVEQFISNELDGKLDSIETYTNFTKQIESLKTRVLNILKILKSQGKKIVGYGAPAKGTTLLNYFGIDNTILDYIVDRNTLKQGMYVPGVHIPILKPESLLEDRPDYIFILAWNFADEIMRQLSEYKELGGKFIIPIPEPKIV